MSTFTNSSSFSTSTFRNQPTTMVVSYWPLPNCSHRRVDRGNQLRTRFLINSAMRFNTTAIETSTWDPCWFHTEECYMKLQGYVCTSASKSGRMARCTLVVPMPYNFITIAAASLDFFTEKRSDRKDMLSAKKTLPATLNYNNNDFNFGSFVTSRNNLQSFPFLWCTPPQLVWTTNIED